MTIALFNSQAQLTWPHSYHTPTFEHLSILESYRHCQLEIQPPETLTISHDWTIASHGLGHVRSPRGPSPHGIIFIVQRRLQDRQGLRPSDLPKSSGRSNTGTGDGSFTCR